MKQLIEKQILEWQQEIINQKQYILKLEGGVQAYQLLLQELNKRQPTEEIKEEEVNTKVEGILVRECPVCGTTFNTLEQRKIYCRNACKSKACRSKVIR